MGKREKFNEFQKTNPNFSETIEFLERENCLQDFFTYDPSKSYLNIIQPSVEMMFKDEINGIDILKHIESIARKCYKSEEKITDDSYKGMIKRLIKNKHFAMIEHASLTAAFVVDRGITHEIVRHRLASFAQESTRYCNYNLDKFGDKITVIDPTVGFPNMTIERKMSWFHSVNMAAQAYFRMIEDGAAPQEARGALPTDLKAEIVVTMNLREWRHFFSLRSLGTTGAPHPRMKVVATRLLEEFREMIPIVFDFDEETKNIVDNELEEKLKEQEEKENEKF